MGAPSPKGGLDTPSSTKESRCPSLPAGPLLMATGHPPSVFRRHNKKCVAEGSRRPHGLLCRLCTCLACRKQTPETTRQQLVQSSALSRVLPSKVFCAHCRSSNTGAASSLYFYRQASIFIEQNVCGLGIFSHPFCWVLPWGFACLRNSFGVNNRKLAFLIG